MTETTTPRPHRRAVGQLLLGLVPLLVAGIAVLAVLGVRLPATQEPLAAADATATATVTATGLAPQDRGVAVSFTDEAGRAREGLLVLRARADVPTGAEVTVAYDPDAPAQPRATVYADGDAAHDAVGDVVFGIVLVTLVLLAAGVLTAVRVVTRRRLHRGTPSRVRATHVTVRRGLLVRSWLELDTARGQRWLPLHWSSGLARLAPGTELEVRGDPARARWVLPVVDGEQVWPSGRLRDQEPRGTVTPTPAASGPVASGLGRQARSDAVLPVLAPVSGLLWAYVDGSGPAGFALATVVSAGVLFFVPQLLGSAPGAADRS